MMIEAAIVDHGDRPIVVGSGITGLSVALSMSDAVVITATGIGEGSSWLAKGGMAAALDTDDSPANHALDTIAVGGGIVEVDLARLLASRAADRVAWLEGLGAQFDTTDDGMISLGREAGHGRRRIVHAGGDATGAEIMRAMREATLQRPDVDVVAHTRLVDLIRSDDGVAGVLTRDADGRTAAHLGSGVALATGGIGGVYARSTNPSDVTGTGLAAAARLGVRLADLEFVQFHPTALASIDHPAPLISEALRGDGAILLDDAGTRFMLDEHPDAELAPRDVVARAIWRRISRGGRVFLDTRPSMGDAVATRFPSAFEACVAHGIDPRRSPIPVAPAEHFHMGGVAADSSGRTSMPGLWVAGEVASTGVHGANRLASNSLLEGAVIGQRVAEAMTHARTYQRHRRLAVPTGSTESTDHHVAAVREIAWADLGIVRTADGIERAIEALDGLTDHRSDSSLVAGLIAASALERSESRGAHHRADHPEASEHGTHRSFVSPKASDLDILSTDRALAS
jgi:L-aspartate oxidase